MLWAYLTLSVFLFAGLQVEADFDFADPSKSVEAILEARCLKNADAEALEELKATALGLKECLKPVHEPRSEDELFDAVCEEIPASAYKCIGGFIRKMKPCLEEEEKFLPGFLAETFNATFEEECKGGAAGIIELIGSLKNSDCKDEVDNIKEKLAENCLPELKVLQKLEEPNFVITKSDVCGDIEIASNCAVGVIKEACEDDVYEKFLEKVLEPYLSWCTEHTSANDVEID